jgi:hypothetical protein
MPAGDGKIVNLFLQCWELVGKLPWICPALEPVLSCTMQADLDLKTIQGCNSETGFHIGMDRNFVYL